MTRNRDRKVFVAVHITLFRVINTEQWLHITFILNPSHFTICGVIFYLIMIRFLKLVC